MSVEIGAYLVASYLLGAIPVGVLAAQTLAGIDPRESGSRNIGFTNVLRVAGKAAGIVTLLGDMGKGALAVLGLRILGDTQAEIWELAAGAAAILGHLFPVFLRFKGGKGVATAIGVLLAVDVAVGGSVVLVWFASAAIWRISSLAALVAFGMLPAVVWWFRPSPPMLCFALGVSALIAYRHRQNIQRLLVGTEPRFGTR